MSNIKNKDIVHIEVLPKRIPYYSPIYNHDVIGIVCDIDSDHIWVTIPRQDIRTNKSYMSNTLRYCLEDISICKIPL